MREFNGLDIIWHTEEGGEEEGGIYCYGMFPFSFLLEASEELKLQAIWPQTLFSSKITQSEFAKYGRLVRLTVKVNHEINFQHWISNLKLTLAVLVELGALISWSGGEWCSPNPIVINPKDGGNVYAAFSTQTGFLCNATLPAPLQDLNSKQLDLLWEAIDIAVRTEIEKDACLD